MSPPVTLHEALVAWLAAHASDPKPEPVRQVQAVLFDPARERPRPKHEVRHHRPVHRVRSPA